MKFKLEITMDNDAFHGSEGAVEELKSLLSQVVEQVSADRMRDRFPEGKLRDYNGNTVCWWEIHKSEEEHAQTA